jgi:hypothetical protein
VKDPRPHQSQDHEQCPEGHEDYFKPEECSWSIFIPEAGAVVRNGGYEVETEWEAHEDHPEDKTKSCRTRFHPATLRSELARALTTFDTAVSAEGYSAREHKEENGLAG